MWDNQLSAMGLTGPVVIVPGEKCIAPIPTGKYLDIPLGYYMHLVPATDLNIEISANKFCIINSGFKEEIKLIVKNTGKRTVVIENGDILAVGLMHALVVPPKETKKKVVKNGD